VVRRGWLVCFAFAAPASAFADGDSDEPPARPPPPLAPVVTPPATQAEPAPQSAPAPDEIGRFEVAARVGAITTVMDTNGDGDGGSGYGLLVDADLGWRAKRNLSIAGFASISTVHFTSWQCATCEGAPSTSVHRAIVFDVGLRLHVHAGRVLYGVGAGYEATDIAGASAPVFEVHLGYTFPRMPALLGSSIQALAVASFAESSGYKSLSLRAGIGVAFY
jgi:hypothetical protein